MKTLKPETISGEKIITRPILKKFISKKLGNKLDTNFCLHMADFKYYLPSYDEAKEIIENSKIKELTSSANKIRGERFDCDDFSLLLKARFGYAAFSDKVKTNFAYCFGIVWGMLPFPFPHSLNWMVTADENGDMAFHFVESRMLKIISSPNDYKNYQSIYFMLV